MDRFYFFFKIIHSRAFYSKFQLINRFAEAIKDPKKVTELKDLLRILCHETPYEDECRVVVNQLDYFIEKLEPYLVQFLNLFFIFLNKKLCFLMESQGQSM